MTVERPVAIEQPVTEHELVAIVKQAAARGYRVRAVGRFHPSSGPGRVGRNEQPGGTDGILIDLAGFGRILRVDPSHRWVTVQAGITLRTLHNGLAARGLALAQGSDDSSLSIGAAVSTGAHGTGAGIPGLTAEVSGLELVTAQGELVSCSGERAPDVFAAARVGLGAVGVISTVTIRCQAGFNLRSETGMARLEEVLASFDQRFDDNDHFQFSWVPGTSWVRTFRANRTIEARGADRGYRVFRARTDLDRRPRAPLVRPSQVRPSLVAYSLPRSAAVAAIGELRARIGNRFDAVPFPIQVRMTAGDDIPLSTASGRPSVYISVPAGQLSEILDSLGGRPQWTGRHGATAAALRDRYPRWDEWQAVRERLDPERRFANAFTDAVLGP